MKKNLPANHLIGERSRYLRQHAHQPVDWYPWGEAAFEKAQNEQKLIFLSIGYSSCHWCHVMAHEAFEDPALAEQMNRHFVNIKVDREEHPEVDGLYMKFAQMMVQGPVGWPLNLIMTPSRVPFFAATYLPVHSQEGQMGCFELIEHIHLLFEGNEYQSVITRANQMVMAMQMLNIRENVPNQLPTLTQVAVCVTLFLALADPIFGGLRGEPKFPLSYQNDFLLAYAVEAQDPRALFLAERTLEKMALGGIYDQLGGGFCRYSVDARWYQPHFEKMLMDQGILIQSYLYGYQVYQKPFFARIAQQTCDFLLQQMRSLEGYFYSSQDADSDDGEGLFYLWSSKEVESLFSDRKQAQRVCRWFGLQDQEGREKNHCVLSCSKNIEEFALEEGITASDWLETLEKARQCLFLKRKERNAPAIDETILTVANGFVIHALFRAGALLQKPNYKKAALEAAAGIRKDLWQEGKLLRWRCQGESKYPALLDDYASMIRAAITLFEGTGSVEWLNWAIEMVELIQKNYASGLGGYYQTDGSDPYLLMRPIEYADGAQPSGNAVHAENLLRLAQITRQARYQKWAEDILSACVQDFETNPFGVMYHAWNALRFLSKRAPLMVFAYPKEAGGEDEERAHQDYVLRHFLPFSTVICKKEGDTAIVESLPYLRDCVPVRGKTTLYLYEEGVSRRPFCGADEIADAIAELEARHKLRPALNLNR